MTPRNLRVWDLAAEKLFAGKLRAVFIECSFDDCQPDEFLFGHLTPTHLAAELTTLSKSVILLREAAERDQEAALDRPGRVVLEDSEVESEEDMELRLSAKKRKRTSMSYWNEDHEITARRWNNPHRLGGSDTKGNRPQFLRPDTPNVEGLHLDANGGVSPRSMAADPGGATRFENIPTFSIDSESQTQAEPRVEKPKCPAPNRSWSGKDVYSLPLEGLLIVIIHVKDTLEDGVDEKAHVHEGLLKLEEERQFGCKFIMATKGSTIFV